ncbi:MAG: phosphohistidine phosphatase SixA [candidate division Zixibacteria bacterium]|nr:phosphohistidine phosphatase SixA [candidate division Zixibacteria bacterium]
MRLFLMRHAIAVPRGTPGYPKDDRPLTPAGIKKMKEAALGMPKVVQKPDVILTSPFKRALHTAQIAAKALKAEKKVKIAQKLSPGARPEDFMEELAKYKTAKNVLIVGHEPDLGKFASALLEARPNFIEFRKGGLCRIDWDGLPPQNSARLVWHLKPKFLRRLAE